MLQQAKNEGLTINVRHAKILFCGASKGGKTSFSRLLRNKEHKREYKSTPAGEAKQVLMSDKVDVVGTNWICLDRKLEAQQVFNRLILKLQNKKDTKEDEASIYNNASSKPDVLTSNNKYSFNDVQSNEQAVTEDTETNINVSDIVLNEYIPENRSLTPASNNKLLSFSDSIDSYDNVQTMKRIGIEDQMINYTDNVNAPVETIPETWDMFTLLDTGGQPEFINMLPAINSSTAITFVVMNISDGRDCFDNLVAAQYKCEGYDYYKRDLKYTNRHLLKCLLSSVKVSAMKNDYFHLESIKRVTEDEHPKPIVCIIGTWADVLKEKFEEKYNEELIKINEEVQKLLKAIGDNKVLMFWCDRDNNYVIPVDNTISRELQNDLKCETCKAVHTIREKSNGILKKKAQYEIPISWFILELELRNNDKVCIPLTEVKEICDRIMPSNRKMNVGEIKEVLKFYHLYGMLLYFNEVDGMNDYVITDPGWLFLNLTKIVMCKFVNDLYDAYLIEEMGKGICSMDLLRTLKLDLGEIELTSFVNLLMYLKVIAPLENAYFIPNILPLCDEKNIFTNKEYGKPAAFALDGQCIVEEVEPLLIDFTFGTIPRGFFGFLIVQLLQDNADTYELCENVCQYSDLISFFIKPYWQVCLRDKISYLELQVRVIGNEPSYHYKVQNTVCEALRKVCHKFKWQFSNCRYGFLCHKHQQGSQGEHLTPLPTKPPYPDGIPKSACCKSQPTFLSEAHKIWFKVCSFLQFT